MNYQNFTTKSICFLLSLILISSCTNKQENLRLVYPNKVNYESFILANDNNLFNAAQNKIEIQTVNSGIQAAEAFNTGNTDIIATGNGPAAIILSNNPEAVIIARYATGERMHRMIADTSIHSINDLKGKRIGVQQGSSTHATLLNWFQNNGLSKDAITLVPMQPSNMPEAMKNKQLDAIAGSEPWALNVEKLCNESVYEFSNLYDENNTQAHVLITKRSIYGNFQNQINEIVNGLSGANQLLNSQPEESAQIISNYIGLTIEEQMICTSRLNWELGWNQSDTQSLEQTAKILFELKEIRTMPNIEEHLINE